MTLDSGTTIEAQLLPRRIAAEAKAEAARIAVEAEAARVAESEAARITVEVEAAMIAAMFARRDAKIAAMITAKAGAEATSIAAEAEAEAAASAHRPVKQSSECTRTKKYSIPYLQGKMADESSPPQALPTHVTKILGNKVRYYAGHYPPQSQGKKSYTDLCTSGPTAKMNEIIYDGIYASLPDNCKLPFAQMFCNYDDLCPIKAPLNINGKKLTLKSISSIFSLTRNVLNGCASF
jgi:hypothetical protein